MMKLCGARFLGGICTLLEGHGCDHRNEYQRPVDLSQPEVFTASNGIRIIDSENEPAGLTKWAIGDAVFRHTEGEKQALREYFRAERDQELGRWRWPDAPDYVVYGNAHSATVFHEPTGSWGEWGRRDLTLSEVGRDSLAQAAEAYFEAHPEPTPLPREPHTAWVDKYGTDIWWVDGFGVLRCCASPSSDPAKYAPFTQLVKAVSDD